jgi:hypothetical protein
VVAVVRLEKLLALMLAMAVVMAALAMVAVALVLVDMLAMVETQTQGRMFLALMEQAVVAVVEDGMEVFLVVAVVSAY